MNDSEFVEQCRTLEAAVLDGFEKMGGEYYFEAIIAVFLKLAAQTLVEMSEDRDDLRENIKGAMASLAFMASADADQEGMLGTPTDVILQ